MSVLQTAKSLAIQTGREVIDDDIPSLSAAIAYYTVFSLPPLLVVVVGLAGAVFGPDKVQDALLGQAKGLVGPEGGAAMRAMIENAGSLGTGIGAKLAGVGALLFGAAGAFGQLQKALNRAWEVEEARQGLKGFIVKRFLSFGIVLTIAFLLLVSLAVSAALSSVGDMASGAVPSGMAQELVQVLNIVASLGIITVLFAVMFKTLPDAQIAWRDVWIGGLATSLLFTIGKTAIGFYLGTADPGSAFGAAGALALILIWIYYSALIVLVGAEFTQVWAVREGRGIKPDDADGASGAAGDEIHPLASPRDPAPY